MENRTPLEEILIWSETASKQSIIDKINELLPMEQNYLKQQRLDLVNRIYKDMQIHGVDSVKNNMANYIN